MKAEVPEVLAMATEEMLKTLVKEIASFPEIETKSISISEKLKQVMDGKKQYEMFFPILNSNEIQQQVSVTLKRKVVKVQNIKLNNQNKVINNVSNDITPVNIESKQQIISKAWDIEEEAFDDL
ncbi:hypothetical protein WA158_002762 [Blastocystis sp. Blastoise]